MADVTSCPAIVSMFQWNIKNQPGSAAGFDTKFLRKFGGLRKFGDEDSEKQAGSCQLPFKLLQTMFFGTLACRESVWHA
jgi:hypothetical protein